MDPTFSMLQEAGAFQEEGFLCRLPIPLAGYFVIAENGRGCAWLIYISDKYVELQRCCVPEEIQQRSPAFPSTLALSAVQSTFTSASTGEVKSCACSRLNNWNNLQVQQA